MPTQIRVMTPDQMSAHLDQLLAEATHDLRNAELRDAARQYQTARDNGDRERAGFWSAVEWRVRRGYRLSEAMDAESDHHHPNRAWVNYCGGLRAFWDVC